MGQQQHGSPLTEFWDGKEARNNMRGGRVSMDEDKDEHKDSHKYFNNKIDRKNKNIIL